MRRSTCGAGLAFNFLTLPTSPSHPTTQAMGDARAAEYMRGRRNMEINPQHPIIQALKGKVELESRCALLMYYCRFDVFLAIIRALEGRLELESRCMLAEQAQLLCPCTTCVPQACAGTLSRLSSL